MSLPEELQRLLERDKLGRMWVDVSIPSNAVPVVRALRYEGGAPEERVLDIRWNDEKGRLLLYCDLATIAEIHKATGPRE